MGLERTMTAALTLAAAEEGANEQSVTEQVQDALSEQAGVWGAQLEDWIEFIPQIIAAVVVAVVVFIVYHLVMRGVRRMANAGRINPTLAAMLQRIVRWSFLLIGLLLVLQALDLLESAWGTITGVLALVAVGFIATWSILSNSLCALVLIITRPFSVGDTIEIPSDTLKGEVVGFTYIFTTLKAEDGDLIQIPNNMFFQKAIKRCVGRATVPLDEQVMQEPEQTAMASSDLSS